MTRAVLIDDDPMVRRLLRQILGARGIEVVAEGDDGDQAVDLVRKHRPDVVVMDVRMQRMNGIDATRELRRLPEAPGVVALTSFDSPATIVDAVNAGVAGFIAKDAAPQEMVDAVREVARGEGALSPRAARVVIGQARAEGSGDGVRQRAAGMLASLTERELEVARAVTRGLSNAEIAKALFLSETTVKTHVANALAKVGGGGRVTLAVIVTQAE